MDGEILITDKTTSAVQWNPIPQTATSQNWQYCPYCGRHLQLGWSFCPGCGTSLNPLPMTPYIGDPLLPYVTWAGMSSNGSIGTWYQGRAADSPIHHDFIPHEH